MIRYKSKVAWELIDIPEGSTAAVGLLNGDTVVGRCVRVAGAAVVLSVDFLGHRTAYDIPKTSISRIMWLVK